MPKTNEEKVKNKTKKQIQTDKLLKPMTKNLSYTVLEQESNLLLQMQKFKTIFENDDLNVESFKKITKKTNKNIANILGHEFLDQQELKDAKFRGRRSKDWGIEWNGSKILVMAVARAGLVGAKAFAETIDAYLGCIVSEKDQNGNIIIKEFNTFNVNRSEITDIIYYDPIIHSGKTMFEVIRTGYHQPGFCNPKIHVIGVVSSPDSLSDLDKKLECLKTEEAPNLATIEIILAQLDFKNDNKVLIPGCGDAGDKLFGIQEKIEKLEVIADYNKKFEKHNALIDIKFVQSASDSETSSESDSEEKNS